ncbi:MAG: exo-alpha-sialidase [Planctomycetota bacterium]
MIQVSFKTRLPILFAMMATLLVLPERCSSSQIVDEIRSTGFESARAGQFESVSTSVGTWNVKSGDTRIDDAHARTGDQCLQIAGGVVELEVADGVLTDGQLTFHAERWTRRDPFTFRIEKKSGNVWSEIFNGDETILVGRGFLSRVDVPLADDNISALRFSCECPPETGILIDDLKIGPASPQQITSVEVVPLTLPALVGNSDCALLKLKVRTEGSLNPVRFRALHATMEGTCAADEIESFQLVYSGSNDQFNEGFVALKSIRPQRNLVLSSEQQLVEGDNYFWITCTLKEDVDIDKEVGVKLSNVGFDDATVVAIDQPASIQKIGVAVRRAGDDGAHTYRIPGLVTTNEGTLIAVYDVRYDNSTDLPGNIDVGMSRSADGGRTWEPMKIIMDMGGDPEWSFDGIGDPAVLVDRMTGTIVVAATWSHGNRSWRGSGPGLSPVETGQFMLTRSDDDGITWSPPVNITAQVKDPDWSFLLQGPGKGISMSDGTIVFPAQYQDPPHADDRYANRLPHPCFIFSRDHGDSWEITSSAWSNATESQVIELRDGELMINARTNESNNRAVLTTTDMGETWQQHATHLEVLNEPRACMASLINVGRELGWRGIEPADDAFLLFSNPDSLSGRNHMTIKASLDSGRSWRPEHKLLLDEQNGFGYSCMSMIDAETVGIIYEGSQAHMTFQRVKLADIPGIASDASGDLRAEDQGRSLSVSRVFGSHMVLQAGKPIRVSGRAPSGSLVTVTFGQQSSNARVNDNGGWIAELAPEQSSQSPRSLSVHCGGETVLFEDVLVGEVWFCAGQSNMQWPLSRTMSASEIERVSGDEQLRLFNYKGGVTGGGNVYSEEQLKFLQPQAFAKGEWMLDGVDSAADFSAVGYQFALSLREELDRPVGIINVSAGGTPIESWLGYQTMADNPGLEVLLNGSWLENPALDGWCKQRALLNLRDAMSGSLEIPSDVFGPGHPFKPGFMYSAAVEPFQSLSLAGVLWYQGESNADSRERIRQYQIAFPELVDSWRRLFMDPGLPFGFVQLPSMNREHWPLFREQQRRSLSKLENVGMAVTIDVGERNDVHPRRKAPVANRLAIWALADVYGRTEKPASAPLIREWNRDGSAMVLKFDHCPVGLTTTGGEPEHFEVAGADGVFHAANASITGRDSISVESPMVSRPVHVRYAWSPFPEPPVNLFNSFDVPAAPFSTDPDCLADVDQKMVVKRIWDQSPHNAFTDLVLWKGKLYCTFRTGTGHVPGENGEDGRIQLIVSDDGELWESVAHVEEEGIDLRDPKLSISPDGRLMLLIGGSNYDGSRLVDRGSRVTFLSEEDEALPPLAPVRLPPEITTGDDWLWRVTWLDGVGYGVVYQANESPWGLHLVKTCDGISYELVESLGLQGSPNESTIRFDDDGEMQIVVRNEQGNIGHYGVAAAPYTGIQWKEIPVRLGGPDLLKLGEDRWLLATRKYGDPSQTMVGFIDDDGQFEELVVLPSAGDTSYPRMLVHGDELLVSYYSGHEERTSIYLARIPLADLHRNSGQDN